MRSVKEGVEEEGKKEGNTNGKEREETDSYEEEKGKEIGVVTAMSDKVNTSVPEEAGEGSRGTWHFYAIIAYSNGTNKLYLLPIILIICTL